MHAARRTASLTNVVPQIGRAHVRPVIATPLGLVKRRYMIPPRSPQIDRLARALAQSAGQHWDALANYPGYSKAHWREQAAALLGLLDPA